MPHYCTVINNIHGFQQSEWIRSYSLVILFAAYFVVVLFIFWTCCLLTLSNYHVASFSFMRHSAVTLNINLSPLPAGEQNFEEVPENIAGKSAWSSWQSKRDICINMKNKLPEENGISELLFHLHASMSSLILLCLENPTEAHGARNVSLLKDKLVELYTLLPMKRHAF